MYISEDLTAVVYPTGYKGLIMIAMVNPTDGSLSDFVTATDDLAAAIAVGIEKGKFIPYVMTK
jgi:hypothetical protein